MNQESKTSSNNIFVFLEIFSCEGGIQSYVKDILNAYQALLQQAESKDNQPEVFLLRDSPDCDNPFDGPARNPIAFRYFKTKPAWLGRVRLAMALLGRLLQGRSDRVFCGHIKLAPLIRAFCQPLNVPYVVLTYGKEVWEPLSPAYRQALADADAIWTISRYSRDLACQSNHLDPDKFVMLPCAVDGTVFSPKPKPSNLLEKYESQNAKVLMTVARLWSGDIYKGVDVTIRALPQIARVFPEVKYLVIGRGDDRPRLERLAQELGIADRVVFAGFVPTEDLPDYYRVADAYIMPSREGFGIVYLEAMASGIPVLAGHEDGSADPLLDGKLGWQVPYRDPDAVARGCIELLKGGDRRCDGAWLRQQALAHFGTDAFTQRLRQLLNLPVG